MLRDISWLFVRALFKAVGVWFADFNLYSGSALVCLVRGEEKRGEGGKIEKGEKNQSEEVKRVLYCNFSIRSVWLAGRGRARREEKRKPAGVYLVDTRFEYKCLHKLKLMIVLGIERLLASNMCLNYFFRYFVLNLRKVINVSRFWYLLNMNLVQIINVLQMNFQILTSFLKVFFFKLFEAFLKILKVLHALHFDLIFWELLKSSLRKLTLETFFKLFYIFFLNDFEA